MSNIYTLNKSVIIGIKRLTSADLGSDTSHQTHIGLFEGTLSNLPYTRANYFSRLFFNNSFFDGIVFLKFINNNRSPAINLGTIKEQNILAKPFVSIGTKIRDIAKSNRNINWYLIWFVLENEEIITILFNDQSIEYKQITQFGFNLANIKQNGFQIDVRNNPIFVNFLTNYINKHSLAYLEKLEIIAQTDEIPIKIIKPRFFDIERAKKAFAETGKKGEELIAIYLEKLKSQKLIINYSWVNQSRETGYPFDFEINSIQGEIIYTDVKTTSYTFNQGMIFSKSELSFINQSQNYHVYRVFDLNEEKPSLRICQDIKPLSNNLVKNINVFENELSLHETKLNSLKVAILPSNKLISFDSKIVL